LTLGATIYTADSAPTDTSLWIYVCGDNTLTITGYTKLAYFSNSGILKGLPNLYTIPTNTDIQAAGLTTGDQNFAYFDGLVASVYLLITKATNYIIRIIARKKQ